LLVEAVERGALPLLVVPGEDGLGVVLHGVDGFVHVGVGDAEDGLEVVDVGSADQLFVGGHGVLLQGAVGRGGQGDGDVVDVRAGTRWVRAKRATATSSVRVTAAHGFIA